MTEEKDPKNGDPNGNGNDKNKDTKPKGEAGDDKRFSQDDVNRLMGDRATRAGLAKEKEILETLGVESLDDAKKLLEAQRKREDQEKSDLEREKEAREAAEKREKDAIAAANEKLIRAEFIMEASRANVEHPDDAFSLADKSDVKIDDSGKVTGVADAVKTLVEAGRLPMSGKKKAPDLDGGDGTGNRDKKEKLTEEEAGIAAKMGLTPEQYRASKGSATVKSFDEKDNKKE